MTKEVSKEKKRSSSKRLAQPPLPEGTARARYKRGARRRSHPTSQRLANTANGFQNPYHPILPLPPHDNEPGPANRYNSLGFETSYQHQTFENLQGTESAAEGWSHTLDGNSVHLGGHATTALRYEPPPTSYTPRFAAPGQQYSPTWCDAPPSPPFTHPSPEYPAASPAAQENPHVQVPYAFPNPSYNQQVHGHAAAYYAAATQTQAHASMIPPWGDTSRGAHFPGDWHAPADCPCEGCHVPGPSYTYRYSIAPPPPPLPPIQWPMTPSPTESVSPVSPYDTYYQSSLQGGGLGHGALPDTWEEYQCTTAPAPLAVGFTSHHLPAAFDLGSYLPVPPLDLGTRTHWEERQPRPNIDLASYDHPEMHQAILAEEHYFL